MESEKFAYQDTLCPEQGLLFTVFGSLTRSVPLSLHPFLRAKPVDSPFKVSPAFFMKHPQKI